jgi:hypothetical protein
LERIGQRFIDMQKGFTCNCCIKKKAAKASRHYYVSKAKKEQKRAFIVRKFAMIKLNKCSA